MRSAKNFIPFPTVDDNFETEDVVYYPSSWSSNTSPENSKATSDKLVCVANRIRATGIGLAITQEDLQEVFSPFGPIAAINIIRNKFRYRNGIAFITYYHTIHAQLALQASSPIDLKGNRIYTHQAIQKPRNVNYTVKSLSRRSRKSSLYKSQYKNLTLQEDNEGSIQNPTCSSIDSNIKPLDAVQQSTKSGCSYSLTEPCSTIRDNSKSPCGVESNELPAISKSFESKIQNSQGFNRGDFHKTPSGTYPVAQDISHNQALLENPDYLNWYECENLAANYSTYYGINQMTYQLSYNDRVSIQDNCNYSYDSYEYSLPETDASYNPFYVNNYMYQKNVGSKVNRNASKSVNNHFHQFNSPLYDNLPVVHENKSYNRPQKSDLSCYDKEQPLESQQIKSQLHVVDKSEMKNPSCDRVKRTNVVNKPNTTQISRFDKKVNVSSNKDKSEEPYLSSYQKYAESFVESARLLSAFEEQFCDAPFQFLQPEEDDEPTEYSKLQSRLLRYNLKGNTDDLNDSFMSSDSDDGITVEIEQFQDYEKYLKISRGDTTPNPVNSLETTQTLIEQSTSLNEEVRRLDKSNENETVIKQSTSSNQEVSRLDKLNENENVIEQCTSSNEEVSRLDKSKESEKVIEQRTSLNEEISNLDKSKEIKPNDETKDQDAVVEMSIESGFYLVQVRDVATQFPEYNENLSKTSTVKVDEPSFSNIETQTCTTINEGETTETFTSANPSDTRLRNKRFRYPKKMSKQRRSK